MTLPSGLRRGTVRLEAHNRTWAEEAAETVRLLRELLRSDIADAQHIGSTSIEGICAKPVIDIAVGVLSFDDITKHDAALAEHGIIFRTREHGDQLLYVCGDMEKDTRTHHIHVVIYGGNVWNDYLNFRDYLNCHPDEARQYSSLKQELAAKFPDDRGQYTAGKAGLVDSILEKARIWSKRL